MNVTVKELLDVTDVSISGLSAERRLHPGEGLKISRRIYASAYSMEPQTVCQALGIQNQD